MAQDLVNLHTDESIRTHPLDFLSQSGKAVDVVRLVSEIDWNDVGAVLNGQTQTPEARPSIE